MNIDNLIKSFENDDFVKFSAELKDVNINCQHINDQDDETIGHYIVNSTSNNKKIYKYIKLL